MDYRNIIIKPVKKNYNFKKVLIPLITIFTSLTCIVSATGALFSGDEEVKTHVVTGNLDFEFKRTNLVGEELDSEGYLSPFENDEEVDLTETGVDAFGIDLMVPGSTYTGTFNLKNTGSTAFLANISFVDLLGDNEYLLEKIQVKTIYNSIEETYSLKDFNLITLELGTLKVSGEANFDITLSLPSETDNNAQGSEVSFAIKLEAVQVLKK